METDLEDLGGVFITFSYKESFLIDSLKKAIVTLSNKSFTMKGISMKSSFLLGILTFSLFAGVQVKGIKEITSTAKEKVYEIKILGITEIQAKILEQNLKEKDIFTEFNFTPSSKICRVHVQGSTPDAPQRLKEIITLSGLSLDREFSH